MSSPPPPNPLPTTTTTPNFLQPQKHSHPPVYQTFYNPQHSNSRPHHQQPPLPVSSYPYTVNRPHGFLNSDQLVKANPLSAPLQQPLVGGAPTVSANTKVVGQSSVAFDNSLREKNGDDAFIVIRDRKVQVSEGTSLYAQCRSWLKNGVTLEKQVQISEGTSLYAQCRSWLKNGVPLEKQTPIPTNFVPDVNEALPQGREAFSRFSRTSGPQYPDGVKSLPKPLPASTVEARKEDDLELEEENPENVDHLSAKELLQLHVNHAKKVRARLRNQRLQRIERYKDRLALLLPGVADQQPKNDPAS
ncbi:uncharacterized protein LOC110890634 isoform X1 [Helianthus annuus]|uniref:uncharacterized protein LOC110890634 isoform X1 n=1 Tax=Helianthus annuus TaxID=4232 RepID=UPI001652E3D4|nr:uncharacterized protein LOC110890634 isoform X1 [Helianthus annuus]